MLNMIEAGCSEAIEVGLELAGHVQKIDRKFPMSSVGKLTPTKRLYFFID